MKIGEKMENKERQALAIRKYRQYLKLERGLSPNTEDAYLTDLAKLLHFVEGEGMNVFEVSLLDGSRQVTSFCGRRRDECVRGQAG